MIPLVTASEHGTSSLFKSPNVIVWRIVVQRMVFTDNGYFRKVPLELDTLQGESPVQAKIIRYQHVLPYRRVGLLGSAAQKQGGKLHLKLNIGERPIVNKYCEGKMQRTLKGEWNSA